MNTNSNRTLPVEKTITLSNKSISSVGNINGTIAKTSAFNTILIKVSGLPSGGNISLKGSVTDTLFDVIKSYNKNNVGNTEITANGNYYADISNFSYIIFFNNTAVSGGTVTIEYVLRHESLETFQKGGYDLLGEIKSLMSSANVFKNDLKGSGTFNMNATANVINLETEGHKVLMVKMKITDAPSVSSPVDIRFISNGEVLPFYDDLGNIYYAITSLNVFYNQPTDFSQKIFYVNIAGTDDVVMRNNRVAATCNIAYSYETTDLDVLSHLTNLKPIQLLEETIITTTTETSYSVRTSGFPPLFKFFKVVVRFFNGTGLTNTTGSLWFRQMDRVFGGTIPTMVSGNNKLLPREEIIKLNNTYGGQTDFLEAYGYACEYQFVFAEAPSEGRNIIISLYGIR